MRSGGRGSNTWHSRNYFNDGGYHGASTRGQSSSYRGGWRGGRSSGGRGFTGGRGSGQDPDQHPGVPFLWNLQTNHKTATVNCLAFHAGCLYAGLDDGTVKIYNYVGDSPNPRERFVPAEPAEVPFGKGVSVRAIVVHDAQVFVGLVGQTASQLYCPNPLQTFDIATRMEHMVVCSRGGADTEPTIWLATMSGTIAVVSLVRKPAPALSPGLPQPGGAAPEAAAAVWEMAPKAEVNTGGEVHKDSITHVAEVLVASAGASVLISGDRSGNLGVWNVATGAGMQQLVRPDAVPADPTARAVTAVVEYQGTNFLSASLDGTVHVWAFEASPAPGAIVKPAPLTTYVPQSAAPSGFGPVAVPGVLTIALSQGPGSPARQPLRQDQVFDWLVVSRARSKGLEVVKLGPDFEWGGQLTRSEMTKAVLSMVASTGNVDEHFILVGSMHQIKVFRWAVT